MLTIGDTFPAFTAKAVVGLERGKEFVELRSTSYEGKWKVYFFWPKDFTFVCPTEIVGFNKLAGQFEERDAVLLGGFAALSGLISLAAVEHAIREKFSGKVADGNVAAASEAFEYVRNELEALAHAQTD